MKQNLLVISYDYDLSKRLAEKLADVFSMRVFDQIELFEFDHIPRKIGDVLQEKGKEYVDKKMRSLLKMELDFDDAVFVCLMSVVDDIDELAFKVNLSNFIVFLNKDIDAEIKEIQDKQFDSQIEKEYFSCTKEQLAIRKQKIAESLSDAVVNVSGLSDDQIVENVIKQIKEYYSVN